MVCGPPCSLFVAACQSVHCRSKLDPKGDQRRWSVRCANRIWENFVSGTIWDLLDSFGVCQVLLRCWVPCSVFYVFQFVFAEGVVLLVLRKWLGSLLVRADQNCFSLHCIVNHCNMLCIV